MFFILLLEKMDLITYFDTKKLCMLQAYYYFPFKVVTAFYCLAVNWTHQLTKLTNKLL